MAYRGTSLQLLSKSFQKMSFGIRRTRVASGEVSLDDYGTISTRDSVVPLRVIWHFGSPDRRRQFQNSKGLLISAIETLRQSRPLIVKGFNRMAREFSCAALYKWPI